MSVLPADRFPGAEHDPLAYPGQRPDFSYVYYRGQVHEITPHGDATDDLRVDDQPGEIPLNAFLEACGNAVLENRHAVLAVGSNGCPGRLAEKYGTDSEVAVPVFVGKLADTAVVYSRHLVRYGALPATYLHQPGAVSWISVTMLTDDELRRMDQTEQVGQMYLRVPVPGEFHIDGGPRLANLTAYLDRDIVTYQGKPVLLKMFSREAPDWPVMDEREILSLVFDEADLLKGEPIEARHRELLDDPTLRMLLIEVLDNKMGDLAVSPQGRLVN
jgi:hypothetical protein